VEWKRLVVSEYRNGFPLNTPTSPSQNGGMVALYESPRYTQTYFVTPLRALIGPRPLVFESWRRPLVINQRRAVVSQGPQRNRRSSKVELAETKEPTVSSTPTSVSSSTARVKAKFISLSEAEINQQVLDKERYGGPLPRLMPLHLCNLTFKDNHWVQTTLPTEARQEEVKKSDSAAPVSASPGGTAAEPEPLDLIVDGERSESPVAQVQEKEQAEEGVMEGKEGSWRWRQVVCCVLCKGKGESPPCGRLLFLPSRGQWAHLNCLKCSEGIYETADGILEGSDYLLRRLPFPPPSFLTSPQSNRKGLHAVPTQRSDHPM
jgi:hypothetical protein